MWSTITQGELCWTPVLGLLRLGVDFTFAWDKNNNNNNDNNDNDNDNNNNPHLNFFKGTVLGDKGQGVGIRVKGKGIQPKWSLTLKTKSCL